MVLERMSAYIRGLKAALVMGDSACDDSKGSTGEVSHTSEVMDDREEQVEV